jgi:hypothetical protein
MEIKHLDKKPILYILISASLFGLSSHISPITLAGLLYLGAFLGLFLYSLVTNKNTRQSNPLKLDKHDFP